MTFRKLDNLVQFFGAYFHEDWDLDDSTPEAVIKRFVETNSGDLVHKVVAELDELLSLPLTEEQLSRMLSQNFLCRYLPTETSVRSWLSQVRASLSAEN